MVAPSVLPLSTAADGVGDYRVDSPPDLADLAMLSSALSAEVTAELGAAVDTVGGGGVERVILIALGRAVGRALGGGALTVRLVSDSPPMVAPETFSLRCLPGTEITLDCLVAALCPAASGAADTVLRYTDSGAPTAPAGGLPLELHARMSRGILQMYWWYDVRGFDRCTVEEIAAQFPLALIEVSSG